jgi:N-acetylmuramoyl-L-alanine amidase
MNIPRAVTFFRFGEPTGVHGLAGAAQDGRSTRSLQPGAKLDVWTRWCFLGWQPSKQTGIARREAGRSGHAGPATAKQKPVDRARNNPQRRLLPVASMLILFGGSAAIAAIHAETNRMEAAGLPATDLGALDNTTAQPDQAAPRARPSWTVAAREATDPDAMPNPGGGDREKRAPPRTSDPRPPASFGEEAGDPFGSTRRQASPSFGNRSGAAWREETRARAVVVDPGHGGDEGGSHGPTGLLEKNVVLDLARAVAESLRRKGYVVYLTRTSDRAMRADQRAAIANYRQADLFLSLHASGVGRPQARGFEVMVSPQPGSVTDDRLWTGAQVKNATESRRWASVLRSTLGQLVSAFDRGVTELPNPVLEAANCPACLLEAASLAWPGEVDLLSTPAGRATLARGIGEAVEAFFPASPTDRAHDIRRREP